MKVFFHDDFYEEYSSEPAAESGRMEAIVEALGDRWDLIPCSPAFDEQILTAHTRDHINQVSRTGIYEIAALAAGGAIETAIAAMTEPSFGLICPPGHHASESSFWGFCYFNNMAISLNHLRYYHGLEKAFLLDFDYHYGDGNVNILGDKDWVEILNPVATDRQDYLEEVRERLENTDAEVIAVSAGFDYHINDWGGLLRTEDYRYFGTLVRQAAERNGGGCYGLLEGGYNHNVLGKNVLAFLSGMAGDSEK